MPVYLLINSNTGAVENAIKWDGESEYDPGEGYELEQVSGEPGCPWIGWTRDENGELVEPPAPTLIRYAVVRKLGNLVVDFKMLEEGTSAVLSEPASFEYRLVECNDEDVEAGWILNEDGTFSAPNNGS